MKRLLALSIFYLLLGDAIAQSTNYLNSEKIDPEFKRLFYKELLALDRGESLQSLLTETDEEIYPAFVYLGINHRILDSLSNSVLKDYVTIRGSKSQLLELMIDGDFDYLEISKKLDLHNDASRGYTGVDALQAGFLNNRAYKGAGVLIGIIDSGVDFFHKDLRNPQDSTTRILAIWNQTLLKNQNEHTPENLDGNLTGLNYGVEYSKAQLNNELDGTPANYVRNPLTDPHGTHVAGTAASNGNAYFGKHVGMAPEAELLVVKTDYFNSSIVDALRWLKRKANLAGKPIVVNISLGNHFNSHDGKGQVSTGINEYMGPGFIVVASAGNEGATNIHAGRRIADNSSDSISFTINPYTPLANANNDNIRFVAFANVNENIIFTVVAPDGSRYSVGISNSLFLNTSSGYITLHNYLDLPSNKRYFQVDIVDANASSPPAVGTWKLVYENLPGGKPFIDIHLWRFGATILNSTIVGGDSEFSIAHPANSENAISVGAFTQNKHYTRHNGFLFTTPDNLMYRSSFSSMGPNIDTATIHPIIMGPGQVTLSAQMGSMGINNTTLQGSNYQHRRSSGTSMASPVISGIIALLLEENPNLTTHQVIALLKANARTESYMGTLPNSTYGWGYVNGFKTMAALLNPASTNSDQKTHIAANLSVSPSSQTATNGGFAVQFIPTKNGALNGFMCYTGATLSLTDSINFKLYNSIGGTPGWQIGNTIAISKDKFATNSQTLITLLGNNYLRTSSAPFNSEIILEDALELNARVQSFTLDAGTPYFLVIEPKVSSDNFSLFHDNQNSAGSLINSGGNWIPAAGNYYFFANTSSTDISPLPVTDFNFIAKKENKNAVLSWQLTGVDALEELILEYKGANDLEFETLEKYNSNTALINTFLHQQPGTGTHFYRLKAVERAVFGSKYSHTKLVRFDVELSIYPNPSTNGTLNVDLPAETSYQIKVSALDGKTVYQTSSVGSRSFHLNYLPTGIYLVEIGNESFKTHYKWMLSK